MRPVPIPDARMWCRDERFPIRRTFGAPDGMEELVAPVEVLIDREPDMGVVTCLLIALEPGDLERLAADGHFWLRVYGGALPPFNLTLADEEGAHAGGC